MAWRPARKREGTHMSVEDESITAVMKVAEETTVTCAETLKLLIKLLLGTRAANGQGFLRWGTEGLKQLTSNIYGWVDTKRNLERDGIGNVGQVAWDKTGRWEDRGTYTIASKLADPENIDALRDRLKKLGVTFAAQQQPNGDVLFLYHLRDKDLVNSITAPLVKEWARAVGIDPEDEQTVRDAAIENGVVDSPEQYDQIMSEPDPQPLQGEYEDMYVDPVEYEQLEAEFQAQQADPGLADALVASAEAEQATAQHGPAPEAAREEAEDGPEGEGAASLRDGIGEERPAGGAATQADDMSPDELIGSAEADIKAELAAGPRRSVDRKPTVTPTPGGVRR